MGVAGGNVTFVNAVTLGVNSPTVKLNTLPTLIVSRSTAESPNKNISFAGNVQCVNFLCGVNAILQTATMVAIATYLFVNTGSGTVVLSLDNAGTVGGAATYNLAPGAVVEFSFDGTKLS
jgi:hypothetical protein